MLVQLDDAAIDFPQGETATTHGLQSDDEEIETFSLKELLSGHEVARVV